MRSEMEKDILKVLVTEEELKARVEALGAELYERFEGKSPLFVSVLKGSFVFMADLVRQIPLPVQLEFMSVSSYGSGTSSSGQLNIRMDLETDIQGRDVLLVEDIFDSGNTLSNLMEQLKSRGPRSLKLCVLLDKPDRHVKKLPVDYLGFSIPDAFVVGYGLDYDQKYRNLPYIGILKPEIYE